MQSGEKAVARKIVYRAMDIIREKTGKDPIEVLDTAIKNAMPILEVRPRRVGGATYTRYQSKCEAKGVSHWQSVGRGFRQAAGGARHGEPLGGRDP